MTLADPPTERLSVRLRSGTRPDHDAAQGSGFLDRLAGGSLPRAAYVDLATQHWFIYEALERATVAMSDDPVGRRFVFPELTRLPALSADLLHLTGRVPEAAQPVVGPEEPLVVSRGAEEPLMGSRGAEEPLVVSRGAEEPPAGPRGAEAPLAGAEAPLAPLPATVEYRERLQAVAFDQPWAFVAHHYTRYLGDLSGGQFLGPAIAQAYGLAGAGHRFFVFDGVKPPAFRTRYRELLDETRFSPSDEELFLAEVSEAYRLNIAVLAELKERWGQS